MYFKEYMILQIISASGLLIILNILQKLSRRLGEALHMKAYYHLFSFGCILIFISILSQFYTLVFLHFSELQQSQIVYIINFLMAAGVTFNFVIALKYWGWLFREII